MKTFFKFVAASIACVMALVVIVPAVQAQQSGPLDAKGTKDEFQKKLDKAPTEQLLETVADLLSRITYDEDGIHTAWLLERLGMVLAELRGRGVKIKPPKPTIDERTVDKGDRGNEGSGNVGDGQQGHGR